MFKKIIIIALVHIISGKITSIHEEGLLLHSTSVLIRTGTFHIKMNTELKPTRDAELVRKYNETFAPSVAFITSIIILLILAIAYKKRQRRTINNDMEMITRRHIIHPSDQPPTRHSQPNTSQHPTNRPPSPPNSQTPKTPHPNPNPRNHHNSLFI